MLAPSERARPPALSREVALYSILGFWLFYVIIVTTRAAVMDFPSQSEMAARRAVVTVFGIVVTWVVYLLLKRVDHRPLGTRIATAFVAALPAAAAIAAFNYYIFNVYDQASLFDEVGHAMNTETSMMKEIAELAIQRYFFLIAWAAIYLAISYAGEVRAAERRAAAFQQAAQAAELRSLRYQVNPHFLFNTLNSLSSLVMTDRKADAEAMIMNLSTFYRTSLSGDPLDDVPLEEEVRLQRLYLDIERVRFPDRLRVEIDIPESLQRACVPGLILQPLVENALKYGVARARTAVTIAITAREDKDRMVLSVIDDGPGGDGGHGAGIGLANVRDRLATRFGDRATLDAEARPEGGFAAVLKLPVVKNGC
ncbi:sensor histidine kinase [Sphingomonas sanxanigenens]|uniref:sensor histidine kinase n=1 Tax=Sphingomonas sanxanigenens TaxID=397260 RepID=UPI00046CB9F7|nr:histidine kinase [Sphingomonas sanxanigenens]